MILDAASDERLPGITDLRLTSPVVARHPSHWRCPAGRDDRGDGPGGVTVGLLSAWWGAGRAMIGNDEVAALVVRFPDRFVGVASVDLRHPREAARELRRCVRELGFRALRVIPRYPVELVDYMKQHGRTKVLFGSNHPAWPAAECLDALPALGLDAETEALFLRGNARRVFALDR